MITVLYAIIFLLLAPFVGGLIAGVDRRVTARMQGRVGPPLLQPFYDVFKLFEKDRVAVTASIDFFIFGYLVFVIATGMIFFAGGDLLLVVFALSLAHVFLVLGAYASHSPYSHIGAERELIQIMAVEPLIILTALGAYMVTGSFSVSEMMVMGTPAIVMLPGIFLGLVYILTIKLRKSPFDLSTSHHAHQELVKGLTVEFAGRTLGMVEIAHFYETVLLMGLLFMFFGLNAALIGIVALVIIYFIEIFIDNNAARVKWQFALLSAWGVTIVLGIGNLAVLAVMGV